MKFSLNGIRLETLRPWYDRKGRGLSSIINSMLKKYNLCTTSAKYRKLNTIEDNEFFDMYVLNVMWNQHIYHIILTNYFEGWNVALCDFPFKTV